MPIYKCIEIKDKNIWNNYILNCNNPQVLQSYMWGEIKQNFSWKSIILGILKDDKLCGGILLLKRTIPYSCGKSMFYAPRGPIIDFKDNLALKSLIEGIKEINKKHNAFLLKIDPFIMEDDKDSRINLEQSGFIKAEQEIQPRCTFILDLSGSLDEIMKKFEPKTRYNIKLAVKKGVTINQIDNNNGVVDFYKLLQETAARDKFTIHSEQYYKTVWDVLRKEKKCEIFLASVENKTVAGVFLFVFNNTCWYMYGASNNQYRNYMPNQLLHWEVISWAKTNGIKYYDFWGIPCNINENHPLWGVYRFKKGFGGDQVKLIGCYDLPLSEFYYSLFKFAMSFYKKAVNFKTRGTFDSALEE